MKKLLLTLAAVVVLAAGALAQENFIKVSSLPSAARQNVKTYYPTATIVSASKMVWNGKTSFKAAMDNGSYMFFDASGRWNMARSYDGLPDKFLPAKVRKYVSDYHEGQLIVEVQKLSKTYIITLSDETKLQFYHNGNFYGFK